MKALLIFSFFLHSIHAIAQTTADDYYDSIAMADARKKLQQGHGHTINSLFIGERLESRYNDGNNELVWEAQGWIGRDTSKLWLKTEGDEDGDEAEFQALFSRAISPFWDLQFGLRHDFKNVSRDYAVLSLMGLAPYWFELDAAAFISEKGDTSLRVEAEYELRFSQRLILQPRMELNYAFSEDLQTDIGQGLSQAHFGLRLRYEIKREVAPYFGVVWKKSFGETADLLKVSRKDTNETSMVVGLRVWY